MWTDSVVVAASVAITGHAPRLHCMLDVVSSEPVSRGANVILCFKQKHRTHCAHGEACCSRPAAGIAGCCCLEEAGMNSLARGICQFQVLIQFEAMGVCTGNRYTSSIEALFSNEK